MPQIFRKSDPLQQQEEENIYKEIEEVRRSIISVETPHVELITYLYKWDSFTIIGSFDNAIMPIYIPGLFELKKVRLFVLSASTSGIHKIALYTRKGERIYLSNNINLTSTGIIDQIITSGTIPPGQYYLMIYILQSDVTLLATHVTTSVLIPRIGKIVGGSSILDRINPEKIEENVDNTFPAFSLTSWS